MNELRGFELLHQLLTMSQQEVKEFLYHRLIARGYAPIDADGFLYAKGNIPIGLVAHMDTICNTVVDPVITQGVVYNPNGSLGADGRAGIYAICLLLDMDLKPTILLLEDGGSGEIGAKKFAKVGIVTRLKYLIELARKGADDAVFYEKPSGEFLSHILSYGFTRAVGTFSDISIIAPSINVPAVNLSIGYYNERRPSEFLVIKELMAVVSKVYEMLSKAEDTPYFIRSISKDWIEVVDAWLYNPHTDTLTYVDGTEVNPLYISAGEKLYDSFGYMVPGELFDFEHVKLTYADFAMKDDPFWEDWTYGNYPDSRH